MMISFFVEIFLFSFHNLTNLALVFSYNKNCNDANRYKILVKNMEYNIYLDVFFLRNFVVNLLLLWSVRQLFQKKYAGKRSFLAAGLGSLGNSLLLLWMVRTKEAACLLADHFLLLLAVEVLTAWIMISVAFGRKGRETCFLTITLWFLAFCTEGALRWTSSPMGLGMIPLLSALIGRERRRQAQEIQVILTFHGRKKQLHGFYDSGNRLSEPLTGKMVHLVCYEEIRELFPEPYQQTIESYFRTGILESTKVTKLQMYEFTFLSYHSIGKETGQLLGIRMDSAVFLTNAGEKTEERALIGLTRQKLFVRGQSQMIINGRLEL